MSKLHVATIITPNHLDKAYTMIESMRKFHDCHAHILIVGAYHKVLKPPTIPNTTFYTLDDMFSGKIGRINSLIFDKYKLPSEDRPPNIAKHDYLRWALKAGFIYKLLESNKNNKLYIYCDCDLHFYNDYHEIIDYSSNKSITISPHWRTIHSTVMNEFQYNFKHGLYNGGFFICTHQAMPILEWWAERCCVECSATSNTTYVDQKYLDLVPLYFDNVGIIKHKGCNVAGWNMSYLQRSIKNGETLVSGQKIIFIHYSKVTVKHIEDGHDKELCWHLSQYKRDLMKQQINFIRQGKQEFISSDIQATEVI